MIRNVWHDSGKLTIRGKRKDMVRGRSAFKLPALLSMHFSGRGDQYLQEGGKVGALQTFYHFIEHTQQLFGDEEIVFRVLGECGGWPFVLPGKGMFGSPARDQGIHDVAHYRVLCQDGDRIRELSALNLRVLEELFKASEATGCVFEYVVDGTLKHAGGLCVGIIDHVIRQTAATMRVLQDKYPRAAIFVNARNEWEVLNETEHTLAQVNAWAMRFYRWKHPATGKTAQGFEQPDNGYEAEQWPEGFIIVDQGGDDLFDYDCGPEPGKFKMGAVHPRRKGGGWTDRSDWWEVTPAWMERLRSDSRGQPVGFTESMYFVSKAGTEGWYRNRNGWNDDIAAQLAFYEQCEQSHGPDLWYVHDDIGVQSDPYWNAGSKWEAALAEFLGGRVGEVEPPPPETWPPLDQSKRPYDPWVLDLYRSERIYSREPDEVGRGHWNGRLEAYYFRGDRINGSSIEQMRDSFLSASRPLDEFRAKHDGPWNYPEAK